MHPSRLRVHLLDLLRIREANVPVPRRRLRTRPVLAVPRDHLSVLLDRRGVLVLVVLERVPRTFIRRR